MTAPSDPLELPSTQTEPAAVTASARSAALWRSVWRWHFYAAIFVLPVLLTLAITGLGILVKPTLERTFYGDRTHVTAAQSVQPYEAQITSVLSTYRGATVRAVTPPSHSDRSTQIDITAAGGTDLSVYVNPYTGDVLGAIDNATRLNNVLEKIHGTLWVGTLGDYFIELVAGWTLVLMVTGLYLWWPRKTPFRQAFSLRLRTPGRRRLRDLHATPGAIFAVVVILLIVTGLPWSGFWGKYWGGAVRQGEQWLQHTGDPGVELGCNEGRNRRLDDRLGDGAHGVASVDRAG